MQFSANTKFVPWKMSCILKSTWCIHYVSRLFFVQTFKIVVSYYYTFFEMTDPIFMILGLNEQITAAIGIHPTKAWLSQLVNFKNAIWTSEERYAIKFWLKLGKMPQKRMECFRLLFDNLAWIEYQFLSGIWDSRKPGSLWGMMRDVEGVRKSIHQSWLAKGLGLGLLCWGFKGVQEEIPWEEPALFKSGQWHFHQDNAPVHNSIFVTDYLTKMGIKTVPQPPYSPDVAPYDFCLFPKFTGCRYETIEEMKEVATKIIDTLTQEDFDGAFQKSL